MNIGFGMRSWREYPDLAMKIDSIRDLLGYAALTQPTLLWVRHCFEHRWDKRRVVVSNWYHTGSIRVGLALICAQLVWLPVDTYAEAPVPPDHPSRPDLPTFQLPTVPPDALGREQPRLPEKKPGSPPKIPEMVLPPLEPVPKEKQRLSTSLRVFVDRFQFIGNTVFSDAELASITRPHEKRTITSAELQNVRHQITRYYVDRGYINSGALIHDQNVKGGIIRIHIVEGELTGIHIEGNDWLRSSYIDKRIGRAADGTLNVKDLQERLLLLQQDLLIDHINAELRPGLKPGESHLNVQIKEARPYQMGVQVANDRSPSIGGISGKVWLTHRNLTGFGDALYFAYGRTEGLNDFNGSYSVPLNAYDTRLKLYYQNNESDVVENPFAQVDISSRSETFGVSLNQSVYKTPRQTFSLALSFEHRRSKTFLLGKPTSFSDGVPTEGSNEGESTVSVFRFSQEWLDRSITQVIAARSVFNVGIDAFDATINSSGSDGKFFAWLGQFQWVRRLPFWNSQMIFRGDVQLASNPLLPLEKFSVGGMYSVRGYRENQLVRDNGAAVSLEWRVPVFRLPIPGLSKSISDGQVQIATFADFGWSENTDLPSPDPASIGSWGLGLRWDPSRNFHSEFYWGIPFRKIEEGTEHDLQESGIHFLVSAQFF